MAATNKSKIILSDITGNQKPVTTIKNITMINKNEVGSDHNDDIDIVYRS